MATPEFLRYPGSKFKMGATPKSVNVQVFNTAATHIYKGSVVVQDHTKMGATGNGVITYVAVTTTAAQRTVLGVAASDVPPISGSAAGTGYVTVYGPAQTAMSTGVAAIVVGDILVTGTESGMASKGATVGGRALGWAMDALSTADSALPATSTGALKWATTFADAPISVTTGFTALSTQDVSATFTTLSTAAITTSFTNLALVNLSTTAVYVMSSSLLYSSAGAVTTQTGRILMTTASGNTYIPTWAST
jgi:hypothetical protein